ncbi:class I SAM-dependent methyltransferase [Streptomyces sp. SID7909]|uniref:class I SAM-dependent methyltransferase n=1 Tax=Streptomyces sp. SID7909 TaxID=2706092 RepID=UPI0013B67232|nr:class I SAM-dependent methyltransferase [Streptomyces sp. SID7909]NEC09502.1 methyltransferase domain-containing protein [Streptomyces sp. SID7909]
MVKTAAGSIQDTAGTRSALPHDGAGQYVPTLVDRWDGLIDWDRRREGEQDFFVELLKEVGAHRVLDVAAGTGFHSVGLAEAGFDVTAADGSLEMLRRAVANGEKYGRRFEAIHTDWRTLAQHIDGRYDAVVCLGSSFPHLFAEADRRAVLAQFYEALNPGGVLVLDHRNFDAIRMHRYRSSGNFYYCGKDARVSVAHVDDELCRFQYDFPDGATHHLEVYPILKDELNSLLTQTGFDTVQDFGDFSAEFDIHESDFIIHAARKS